MVNQDTINKGLFVLLFFSSFGVGCTEAQDSVEEDVAIGLNATEEGSCLRFKALDGSSSPPSNITLFFTLETCESSTPVVGINADQFVVYEGGSAVSQFESHLRILPKCTGYDLVTVLLLDLSGSVFASGSVSSLVESARSFAENLTAEEHFVSIHLFDGRPTTQALTPFTKNKETLFTALDNVLTLEPVDTSTNLNGAISDGIALLDETFLESDALVFHGSLVVFTDGTDQAAFVDDESAVSLVTETTHDVFTIGLGGEVDETHLENIGKDGNFLAESTGELQAAFEAISERILLSSQNFYVIGYCSPKRSGTHNITLEVQGYEGILQAEFDANEFVLGCDAASIVDEAILDAKACAVEAPWESGNRE